LYKPLNDCILTIETAVSELAISVAKILFFFDIKKEIRQKLHIRPHITQKGQMFSHLPFFLIRPIREIRVR